MAEGEHTISQKRLPEGTAAVTSNVERFLGSNDSILQTSILDESFSLENATVPTDLMMLRPALANYFVRCFVLLNNKSLCAFVRATEQCRQRCV